MLNRGFVRVFSVLLTLVCLFYLSFSVVTHHYAKQAEEASHGDRVKMSQYIDSLSSQKVWLGYTLKECREMEINLGLDLKGGMNVILELNVADVLKSFSGYNQDENFNKALAAASARQMKEQGNYIDFFAQEYKKLEPNARLAALFSFQFKDKISTTSSDAEVIKVLKTELESAISNSFNVLRTRIDRFGVVAPNIQRLEQDGRILVELPGVKEPERVRKLLQGSANLEFWTTYNLEEVYQNLMTANNVIRDLKKSKKGAVAEVTDSTKVSADSTKTASADTTGTSEKALLAKIKSKAQGQGAGEQAAGKNDKDIKAQYPLLSLMSMQGLQPKSPVVGIAHYRDTAQIGAFLRMKAVRDVMPRNVQFRWTVKAIDKNEQFYQLVAIKVINRNGKAPLSGDVVTDANADFEQHGANASVSMTMDAEGAKEWARLTKENIGKSIAIVLDNYVYSFPRVNDEITGGRSSITGNFTPDEAKDLANVLKSGKMAASVRIVQEDIVGPSLGKEAIHNGLLSCGIALLLIFIYMISVYGVIPGLIANAALIVNLFFTMGILASFQSVLTLSGIAGLVLALAIAVDANVLIYERTKEEMRGGKPVRKAVEEGYKHAFAAIFDSNLTSIITGIILFYFGTGVIKGFATTTIIGIVCSFFTSVFLTRLMYESAFAKGKFNDLTFTTKAFKNIFVNPTYKWVAVRKKGYMASAILGLVIVASFVFNGLKPGIDFTGGRNYIIRFDKPVETAKITDDLKPFFGDYAVGAITIGSSNQIRVTTNYRIAENDPAIDTEINQKFYQGLKPLLPAGTTMEQFVSNNIVSSQKVGPAIAKDILQGAIWAVFFAVIAMGIYIFVRFRDMAFSVGTIASLLHDTLIIVGVYSFFYKIVPFSMDVDQSFIAAVLTVIGYSVNDTVIIFDRIREIMHNYPKRDLKRLMDDSLNSTLSRTMSTSLCTSIVLLCIFILGGDTIRSFTFAMFIGVVIGTYSTFFIAMPVAYEMMKRKHKKQEVEGA
ncbi:protein translocase subunit SecDF [Parabacteroides sp. FAFU027]|uniref:protein translocase subunit SecDF n=1 Tax=Parabacteroides sp. FAFU027 TaxID=2922715 RepID=UPI001FB04032|nr:protein translocase subunit SecDF [Parabacteroides sp. FAFU027]